MLHDRPIRKHISCSSHSHVPLSVPEPRLAGKCNNSEPAGRRRRRRQDTPADMDSPCDTDRNSGKIAVLSLLTSVAFVPVVYRRTIPSNVISSLATLRSATRGIGEEYDRQRSTHVSQPFSTFFYVFFHRDVNRSDSLRIFVTSVCCSKPLALGRRAVHVEHLFSQIVTFSQFSVYLTIQYTKYHPGKADNKFIINFYPVISCR